MNNAIYKPGLVTLSNGVIGHQALAYELVSTCVVVEIKEVLLESCVQMTEIRTTFSRLRL
jgi:hypothetical protein